jgi:hypothetical protein
MVSLDGMSARDEPGRLIPTLCVCFLSPTPLPQLETCLRFASQRNDGEGNLLGAMTIAAHFRIPEVCLYFNNKLLRGNR